MAAECWLGQSVAIRILFIFQLTAHFYLWVAGLEKVPQSRDLDVFLCWSPRAR
jgi:hypothetical protein